MGDLKGFVYNNTGGNLVGAHIFYGDENGNRYASSPTEISFLKFSNSYYEIPFVPNSILWCTFLGYNSAFIETEQTLNETYDKPQGVNFSLTPKFYDLPEVVIRPKKGISIWWLAAIALLLTRK